MTRQVIRAIGMAAFSAVVCACSEGERPTEKEAVRAATATPAADPVASCPPAAPAPPEAPAPPPPGGQVPAPQKPADKAAARRAGSGAVAVRRLVVARDVKDREPVEPGTSFREAEADKVYAFVEVANADALPSGIVVSFEREGGASTGGVELSVGPSPRWRTWAYTRAARKAGAWAAVVRDEEGRELARTPFEVTL